MASLGVLELPASLRLRFWAIIKSNEGYLNTGTVIL